MAINIPKKMKIVRLPWRRKARKKSLEISTLLKKFRSQDKIKTFCEFKKLNSNELGGLGDIQSLMSSMFGGMM